MKFDLSRMLKEIKEDAKLQGSRKKKWASQDDIKEMVKRKREEKKGGQP